MSTRIHKVSLGYERRELLALFSLARMEDVERGGHYTHGGGAINVWSHHWQTHATRLDSAMIGSWYVDGSHNCIDEIECAEGFELDDLLHELALLEEKALGYVKHGRHPDEQR